MKKIVRLFSLMLLAALLFSVMSASAYAADNAIPIGDEDSLAVFVKFDSLTADDTKAYQASIATPAPSADFIVDEKAAPEPVDVSEDGAGPDGGSDLDDDDFDDKGNKGGNPAEGSGFEKNPTPVLPKCVITVVCNGEETVLEEGSDYHPFSDLFDDGAELRITPPDKYYVSGLTLTNRTDPAAAAAPIPLPVCLFMLISIPYPRVRGRRLP